MNKEPQFYDRYVRAVFARSKAETIPHEYIRKQAEQVMDEEELKIFEETLEKLIEQGVVERDGDMFTLKEAKA